MIMKKVKFLLFLLFFSHSAWAFYGAGYDYDGLTPLMQAVSGKDIEGVRFFAKMRPNEINDQNIGGATALHVAARDNSLKIVKVLLGFGARVDGVDNEGYSALMRAASFGNFAVMEAIIAKNPELDDLNHDGESAIMLSAMSSCDQCLALLLKEIVPGYNFNKRVLKTQISKAFMIASFKENETQKQMLSGYLDKMNKKHVMATKKPVVLVVEEEVPSSDIGEGVIISKTEAVIRPVAPPPVAKKSKKLYKLVKPFDYEPEIEVKQEKPSAIKQYDLSSPEPVSEPADPVNEIIIEDLGEPVSPPKKKVIYKLKGQGVVSEPVSSVDEVRPKYILKRVH